MNFKTITAMGLTLSWAIASGQALTLDEALQRAKVNRPALRAAKLNLDQANANRRAAGIRPGITVGAGASSPLSLGATDQDLYIEQQIDIFGRSGAAREVALGEVRRAESTQREVQLGVQGDVLEQFARSEAARDALSVATSLTQVADQLLQATIRRFEEGKIPKIQVTRAEIELKRAKQSEAVATAALASALKLLAGSVGVESVDSVSGTFAITEAAAATVDARPDLLALAANRIEAQAEAKQVAKNRMPELSAVGMRSPWDDRRGQFGARLQVSWAVWDNGKSRAKTQAAEAKQKAAEAAMADARQRALTQLAAIDGEIVAARRQLASYEDLLTQTRELVSLAQKAFREGVGTQIDVLEATRAMRELEQEAVDAKLRINLLLTQRLTVAGQLLEVLR